MSRTQRTLLARIVLWTVLPLMALTLLVWGPRVFATDLESDRMNPLDRTQFAVEKATMDTTSTLYDGGGASNALQLEANSAAVVAGGAAVIDCGGANTIDIQVVNAAATESLTLLLTEYSASTPTVITQIRQIEVAIPTTDLAVEVDLQMVGLSTATGYAKAPVRATVIPGAYLMISIGAESAAGAKYARYSLHGSN